MVSDGRCHCRGCDQARVQGAEDIAKRIRELHKKAPCNCNDKNCSGFCEECSADDYDVEYPCPTIKALEGDK